VSELVEKFAREAEAAGFIVHRGDTEVPANAGLSRATYGVASTGSVALFASPDEPRSRHLLPDVHVTLLRESDIVPDLAALFAAVSRLPSALAIVTGPSRSADIEQHLIVGIHGPAEVHIVLEPVSVTDADSQTRSNPKVEQRSVIAMTSSVTQHGSDVSPR